MQLFVPPFPTSYFFSASFKILFKRASVTAPTLDLLLSTASAASNDSRSVEINFDSHESRNIFLHQTKCTLLIR